MKFRLSTCIVVSLTVGLLIPCCFLCRCACDLIPLCQGNCIKSAKLLHKEGDAPFCLYSKLDNFTDAILLNVATRGGDEGVANKACLNYFNHYNDDKRCGVDSFASCFLDLDDKEVLRRGQYARYWFGAVTFIRSWLLIGDYGTWRILNLIVLTFLIAFVCFLFYRVGFKRYLLALVMSIIMINPIAIAFSLQYSPVFYLMMISSAFILLGHKYIRNDLFISILFSCTGALTSYFDLLTYPISTLCLPLSCAVLLNRESVLKTNVLLIFLASLCWGFGYGVMWASKWCIVSLLTDVNIFSVVFDKVLERSSSRCGGVKISIFKAVAINIWCFFGRSAWLALLFLISFLFSLFVDLKRSKVLFRFVPLFIIGLIPFLWMIGTSNHIFIHAWFTNKSLVIPVFIAMCWMTDVFLYDNKRR